MVLYTVKAHVETKGQGISTTISIVNAMYRKIRISKISWFMPHIQPSIDSKLMLEKVISSKTKIPVAFRAMQCDTIAVPQSTSFSWRLTVKTGAEKPRWLIVGFQTAKSSDQLKNPALFDHMKVTNIYMHC